MSNPGRLDRLADDLTRAPLLAPVGLLYLGLGVLLGAVWLFGDVSASLFPTGWIFPAVLVVTGTFMAIRRRFDIVGSLWAGLTLAVFTLDLTLYMNTVNLGAENLAGFDAGIVVALFALVPLLLRPQFRQ